MFNEKKATEAASTLLAQKGGRADYLWIIKMLYLIDREALKRWERPITYDTYKSMPYGPVVSTILDIIKKKHASTFWKQFIVTLPNQSEVMLNGTPAPTRKLSQAEVELISDVFAEFGNMTGLELVDYTHHLPEWKDPKGSSLPLEISDILKNLDYDSNDIKRINAEIREEESVDATLRA